MATEASGAKGLPVGARLQAVNAVRLVFGVASVVSPVSSIWRDLAGLARVEHDLLVVSPRGAGIEVSIDIEIESNANALEVAGNVQECVFQILASHMKKPDELKVLVTVL